MTREQFDEIVELTKRLSELETTDFDGVELCQHNTDRNNRPTIHIHRGIRDVAKLYDAEITVVDFDVDYDEWFFEYDGMRIFELVDKDGSKYAEV